MTRAEFRVFSVHYAELLSDIAYIKWAQSIVAYGNFTDILNASIKRGKAEREIKDFQNGIKTKHGKLALIAVQIRGHIMYKIEMNSRKRGLW